MRISHKKFSHIVTGHVEGLYQCYMSEWQSMSVVWNGTGCGLPQKSIAIRRIRYKFWRLKTSCFHIFDLLSSIASLRTLVKMKCIMGIIQAMDPKFVFLIVQRCD